MAQDPLVASPFAQPFHSTQLQSSTSEATIPEQEQRWVEYAQFIAQYAPQELKLLLQKDLCDRDVLAYLRSRFHSRKSQRALVLQSVPPEIVGIECPCAYPLCPRGYTTPSTYRLSLERCENLQLTRVPVLPVKKSSVTPDPKRGRGRKGQVWYCLECIESVYNGIYATGLSTLKTDINVELSKFLEVTDRQILAMGPLNYDALEGSSKVSQSPAPTSPHGGLVIRIKAPRPDPVTARSICGLCHEPRGKRVMLACRNIKVCPKGIYFHLSCLQLKRRPDQVHWLCPFCKDDVQNHPSTIEKRTFGINTPDDSPKNAMGNGETLVLRYKKFQSLREWLVQYSQTVKVAYPAQLTVKAAGQTGLQQISSFIYPETRHHDSEFFTLSFPQQHTVWLWKNTILRQDMAASIRHGPFQQTYKVPDAGNADTPCDVEVGSQMTDVDDDHDDEDDDPPVRGFMNYGGYLCELTTDKVWNKELSDVLKTSDEHCQAILDNLGEDRDFELFVPRPKVWKWVSLNVKPEEEEEEIILPKVPKGPDDTESSGECSSSSWDD